jgi:hypothetical protein
MRRATRTIWAERIAQWERSGLTAAAFATRAGVNAQTLTYWKWRLKSAARTKPLGVGFVEMIPSIARETSGAEGVDVTSPTGYRLRVPADIACDRLRALLDVLDGRR